MKFNNPISTSIIAIAILLTPILCQVKKSVLGELITATN